MMDMLELSDKTDSVRPPIGGAIILEWTTGERSYDDAVLGGYP